MPGEVLMSDLGATGAAAGPSVDAGSFRSGQAGSSRVRTKSSDPVGRAARRVIEFLKVLGLEDSPQVQDCADELVKRAEEGPIENLAERAMRLAQARFHAFREQTFGADTPPDPLWLRAFLGAHPEAFFATDEEARRLAASFGDAVSGSAPRANRFRPQLLGKARFPRWLAGLLPPLAGTAIATGIMAAKVIAGQPSALNVAFLGLFAILFSLVAVGFSTAFLGLFASSPQRSSALPPEGAPDMGRLRTALVVPIYHESAEHVFAAVLAMRESLLATDLAGDYEIFVLSDSQDPLIAADEERAFRRVSVAGDERIPVYYRRRSKNVRQKAGNLEEFFERFGHRYRYAVILDADSVMVGPTIVELVRRMEGAPETALLQAPIVPVGGETVLARSIQWASSVSGPLLMRGLSAWAGSAGNYYGHNAIIRVRAFLECCALPALAGEPPLGGHILSHDFVEAALLRRRGYAVRAATDLGGSYEGLPPTLGEYVARDRRWCQGNLQHLRIATSAGLAPMSRIHMVLGAFSYLAAPLWLVFLMVGLALTSSGSVPLKAILWSWLLTGVLLMGPRFLGLLMSIKDPERRRGHGGVFRLFVSAAAEAVFSALLAPLMMLHHTEIVLSILLGRSVRWGRQGRHDRAGFSAALRTELPATVIGVVAGVSLCVAWPALALWLAPVWVPLCFAVPISVAASSVRVGRWLRRCGLLLVPSETSPDPIVERAEHLRAVTVSDAAGRFRDLVLDPVLVNAHLQRLTRSRAAPGSSELDAADSELCRRALRAGPASLTEGELSSLLSRPNCLRYLHSEAWCHWPVESWQMSRERPQLPPPVSALA